MIDARPLPDKMKLSSKYNFPDAGRPLTYPTELDDELLKWVFALSDFHFPDSLISFQEKAKLVLQHHTPSFNTNKGWVRKSFNRHKLVLRTRTLISQKLQKQLVLSKFYKDAARFMSIGKYVLSQFGNMDETPAFLTWSYQNVCQKKVRGSVWFILQGMKKKHLTATTDG